MDLSASKARMNARTARRIIAAASAALIAAPAIAAPAEPTAPGKPNGHDGAGGPGAGAVQMLAPINVEAKSALETAISPIKGYVAHRNRSATKTDTPLIEVPQAIDVISADQIRAQNATSIPQVLRYTSGTVPMPRGNAGSRYDQFTLRGFNPEQFLDGLRLPGYFYTLPKIDPFLLSRVEVLKGPASVLYGQTPPGGVVNYVSKRPSPDQINQIFVQGGNDARVRGGLDIGGKLDKKGDVLYRFVATGRRSDGTQDDVGISNYSIAPSVKFHISDATDLTVLAKYRQDPEGGAYSPLPYVGAVKPLADGDRLPRDFYSGDHTFERFKRKDAQIGYEFSHWFNDSVQFRQHFRYEHDQVDYRSVYGQTLTADQSALDRGIAASTESLDGFDFDNQLLIHFDTGPVKHTVLAGIDYQNNDATRATGFGIAPPLNLAHPDHSQTITNPARTTYDFDQDQLGYYLQDQVKIGHLVLIGGGRYDTIQTSQAQRASAMIARDHQSRADHAFSGRAGLLYEFAIGLAPYFSYTESFQPPSTDGVSANVLEPTQGHQYELGVKYQPPGVDALVTASLFQITQSNVTGPLLPNGTVSQTGEVEVQGAEIDGKASLAAGLDVSLAASYLDSEITQSDLGNQGNELQQTPQYTASLWLDYTRPGGAWKGLGGGGGVRYVGAQQVTNANNLQVPDYTLFDATLHYDLGGLKPAWQGWRVALNVQNVFDKKYVSSCYSRTFCYYGYGRQTTATVSYHWR